MSTPHTSNRPKQLRLAMYVIRRHLEAHPNEYFHIDNPFQELPEFRAPDKPWTAKLYTILTGADDRKNIARTFDAVGETRLDAVVALADKLAAASLPLTALHVLLDWLGEHEVAKLTLYSPASIDDHQLWSAHIGVPVQILADEYGTSAHEALTRLACRISRLPESIVEAI